MSSGKLTFSAKEVFCKIYSYYVYSQGNNATNVLKNEPFPHINDQLNIQQNIYSIYIYIYIYINIYIYIYIYILLTTPMLDTINLNLHAQ